MKQTNEPIEQVSADPRVQRHYLLLRRRGFPHVHAKRLSHGKWLGIGVKTDATFMHGRQHADEFDGNKVTRSMAEAKARAAGVNPNGKVYSAGLATEQYDPNAWIDSVSDVKRICNNNGWSCEGSVNVQGPPPATPPDHDEPYCIADDLVEEELDQRIGDEYVPQKERDDMFEAVQTELSGD